MILKFCSDSCCFCHMGHFNQHFVHNFYRSNNFPPHKDIHVIFQIGMEQNSRLQFQGKINSLLMKAFIVHVILQMTSLHDISVQDKQELNFNQISYYKEYTPFSSSLFTISTEIICCAIYRFEKF